MDIKPPSQRPKSLPRPEVKLSADTLPYVETPLPHTPIQSKRWGKRQWWTFGLAGGGLLLLGATLSVVLWYRWAIQPVSASEKPVRIIVESGETAASISDTLRENDLIRSRLAFTIYVQISGQRTKLQAGGYVLSPSQDVPTIVEHIATGKTDEFNITIPPGLTLKELREHFKQNGYSDAEITSAFNASYSHPLLDSRPVGATLEGYIYPETYRMNADQSLEALINRSFDELYKVLQEKHYLEEFSKHNLTIHQALTLASIVQKEVKDPIDQKQVAQVFLKRLGENIQLGSDVTYMYAAEQLGVRATPSLNSPYNTRKYKGLPPGPIATMNPSALEAVAFPAPGDYLYFVAGDDGKTYFSKTEAEHNANIKAHCTDLCN